MSTAEQDRRSFQTLRAFHDTDLFLHNEPHRSRKEVAEPNAARDAVASGIQVECNAVPNMDLDGPAVSWGLSYKKVCNVFIGLISFDRSYPTKVCFVGV